MSAWAALWERARDPNPIVRKELLALLRTPVYVRSVVVALVALAVLVVSVALAASEGEADLAEAGRILFQVYFGGAYLLLAMVSPVFGATAIVQEREGRTFDALVLTGMHPSRVVTGKLLALFLAMAFIPVAATPVLGVVLLFGGVTLGHLLVATLYLGLVTLSGVAFGIGLSAQAQVTRRAVLLATPLAVFGALALSSVVTGLGVEYARRHSLTLEGPLFFVDAYFAVPYGLSYLFDLVVLPATVFGLWLWLWGAVAYAGLLEPSDDRARPVKLWALGAWAATTAAARLYAYVYALGAQDRVVLGHLAQAASGVLLVLLLSAWVGEPLRRSRRQLLHPPHPLSRALLPPTLLPTLGFLVALGALNFLVGPWLLTARGTNLEGLLSAGVWCLAYLSATTALQGFLAVRYGSSAARIGGALWLFATLVLCWIVYALAGGGSLSRGEGALWVSVSPVWAFPAVVDAFHGGRGDTSATRAALRFAMALFGLWTALFSALTALAWRRGVRSP
ncbi:MAG: ABC transporter permease [Deltaproteobacteria bacterium]|nr:ABC transporter permease [Deltaproteobacteria bacterium]